MNLNKNYLSFSLEYPILPYKNYLPQNYLLGNYIVYRFHVIFLENNMQQLHNPKNYYRCEQT